jgi:thiol-disulfide isomerase/thioredoxin
MVTRLDKRSLQKILSGKVKTRSTCVIKFYSTGCHYCLALKPIYEEISKEFENVNFFVFNIKDYPEVEKVLHFKGVPTLFSIDVGGPLPRRKQIKEPVAPDDKTWYTGYGIRQFIQEI